MKEYIPISCELYDRLEETAIRKRTIILELFEEGKETRKRVKTIIRDLISVNREEFAVLENGEKIRLDQIFKVYS
ncbi:hypothetical protein AB3N59_04375 [Leptospira sp. WS92.C1]